MSVHSLISSNITDVGDLIAILDELGIEWREEVGHLKETGRPLAHAIEALIGNEAVFIFQAEEGEAFVFQSQGWWFRNKGNIQALAGVKSAEQLRRQAQLSEQERIEAERQARIAEQRRQEEMERRQREATERNRLADEQRRIEEERRRIEEQKRQKLLAEEASNLLSQLDARQSQSAKGAPSTPAPPTPEAPASPATVEQMDRIIGKLHQADALRKIRERLPELKDKFGATLEREETLDDETVELRLTI